MAGATSKARRSCGPRSRVCDLIPRTKSAARSAALPASPITCRISEAISAWSEGVTAGSATDWSYSVTSLPRSTSAARTAASGVFISWTMLAVSRPSDASFSEMSSFSWFSWMALLARSSSRARLARSASSRACSRSLSTPSCTSSAPLSAALICSRSAS